MAIENAIEKNLEDIVEVAEMSLRLKKSRTKLLKLKRIYKGGKDAR